MKTDTSPAPNPIRPTRRGRDPNRPRCGSQEGGYDLGGVCPGRSVTVQKQLCETYCVTTRDGRRKRRVTMTDGSVHHQARDVTTVLWPSVRTS